MSSVQIEELVEGLIQQINDHFWIGKNILNTANDLERLTFVNFVKVETFSWIVTNFEIPCTQFTITWELNEVPPEIITNTLLPTARH